MYHIPVPMLATITETYFYVSAVTSLRLGTAVRVQLVSSLGRTVGHCQWASAGTVCCNTSCWFPVNVHNNCMLMALELEYVIPT